MEESPSCSSQSSSPPKEFDVYQNAQYVPIYDETFQSNRDCDAHSSSLPSSLSIESNHDFSRSPIRVTSNCRLIRCPECEKPMRTFYCAKCIQSGRFITLDNAPLAEILLETRYEPRRNSLLETQEKYTQETCINERSLASEMLQIKLGTLKKKTDALRNLYTDQKEKLNQTETLIKETSMQLASDTKASNSNKGKIELIKKYISARILSIKKRQTKLDYLSDELKQYINRRVFQLNTDIFPIEQVNLLEESNAFTKMESSPLLTFSDGSHHQIDQQTAYSIVEPWLPSNGDYSVYSLWVNDNKDQMPASLCEVSERNPAYRIGAALGYTTQLVQNLASYLDVILPARMSIDVFNRELLDDTQFTYNVAKLNANVIYLCVSQGVDVSLLNPSRTLKNLMLLFNLNISDLGKKPIVEIDNEEVTKKVEDRLVGDLSLVQENIHEFNKFTEDDDAFDSEWEMSDTINPMELQQATQQLTQQNSYISRLPLRLFGSIWTGN